MCVAACLAWRAGSSPHTRGLPRRAPRGPAHRGIIPAHAGFTDMCVLRLSVCRDHPRTRGVYGPARRSVLCPAGSSPHTRGLLPSSHGHAGSTRIIPAHAGFTPRRPPARGQSGDHPRTRGVYLCIPLGSPAGLGSSPHTRGLRRWQRHTAPVRRIIPAHAGFTPAHLRHCRYIPDHPRTRGVYLASLPIHTSM